MKAIKTGSRAEKSEILHRNVRFRKLIEAIARQRRQLDHASETSNFLRDSAANGITRKPGRFKGQLVVGPEFFEPLTEEELRDLTGE